MKKLFAFDLDGTLVHGASPGERGIPQYLVQTINDIAKKFTVIIATGRRYRTAMVDVQRLDPMPYLVVHNGSVVSDFVGNSLSHVSMEYEDMKWISSKFETQKIPQLFVMDGFKSNIDFCFLADELERSDILQRVASRSSGFYRVIQNHHEVFSSNEPRLLEMATLGHYQDLKLFQDYLTPRLPSHLRCLVVQNIGYTEWAALEVLPRHVSKWLGVSWVAQQLGIDHVIAVGDDENDIEMLQNASFSIVMGHARPHVKNAAKHEVSGPEELAYYLQREFLK